MISMFICDGWKPFWIDYLMTYHQIEAHRDDRNTGVWVEGRKWLPLGCLLRKWVTWHGFAWNINTDLIIFIRSTLVACHLSW